MGNLEEFPIKLIYCSQSWAVADQRGGGGGGAKEATLPLVVKYTLDNKTCFSCLVQKIAA